MRSSGCGSRAPASGYAIIVSSCKVGSGNGEANPVYEKERAARSREGGARPEAGARATSVGLIATS
eukprot:4945724-Alexandrium_andersonii.AAC.1